MGGHAAFATSSSACSRRASWSARKGSRGVQSGDGVGEEHGVLVRWPRRIRQGDGRRVAAARSPRRVSVVVEGKAPPGVK